MRCPRCPHKPAAMRFLDGPRGGPKYPPSMGHPAPHAFAALKHAALEPVGHELLGMGHAPPFIFQRLAVDPKKPRTFAQHPMGRIGYPGRVAGLRSTIVPEAIHETRDLTLGPRGRPGPTLLQGALP